MTSRAKTAPFVVTQAALPLRTRLTIGLIIAGLLAFLTVLQAVNTYNTAFERFRSIAEDSTAKVDASEAALKNVADVESSAANFVATLSSNPLNWLNGQHDVHLSFQNARDQMFIVRSRLNHPDDPTDLETINYNQLAYFIFDDFWPHVSNVLTAEQINDTATAVSEYEAADNDMQYPIIRYLLKLESSNFAAMQATSSGAASAIYTQTILLTVVAIVLGILLTVLSFWLRWRVRRLLTPGLDAALILGWALAVLMAIELTGTPNRLQAMVQDGYYNVSASARILAVAQQASTAQSGAVIDPALAKGYWQPQFNKAINSIALRICGYKDCLAQPITTDGRTVTANALTKAQNISQADSDAIGGIQPLIANIASPDEVSALEAARLALNDYLNINKQFYGQITQFNTLVSQGKPDQRILTNATTLALGTGAGQSQEAFQRFGGAIDRERTIKRAVFDSIWNSERADLPTHQWLLGVGGYALLIIALLIGAVQRLREL